MSSSTPPPAFVSRGGDKLSAALNHFGIDATGLVCADLGSHIGGFVDCLLRRGAARVYSVDTAYGTLAWRLRKDSRVVVHERTNAMHATLAEPVDLVTIDVGWTSQAKILPNAAKLLREGGIVVSLIKPHYEGPRELLVDGVLPEFSLNDVLAAVRADIESLGWSVRDTMTSPIRGHGGNREVFALLVRP